VYDLIDFQISCSNPPPTGDVMKHLV